VKTIEENLKLLRKKIERACERSGRSAEEVVIVAVSKFVEVERIREAIEAGINVIGENRVQEAMEKYEALGKQAIWHMVGHLQTNKVKKALEIFSMIQSLDSLSLAQEIGRRAAEIKKVVPVLVEVNTSGESTKFGVEPARALEFIKLFSGCKGIAVQGLMTIGPNIPAPEEARKSFRLLADLRKKAEDSFGRSFRYLSMGMSGDFEVAIEEGSNMVRIGTAIFGERDAF
jgi:pyridoxal phosphate enzyme (YggS family)